MNFYFTYQSLATFCRLKHATRVYGVINVNEAKTTKEELMEAES